MPSDGKFGLLCLEFVVVLVTYIVATQGRQLAANGRTASAMVEHKATVEGLLWLMGATVLAFGYSIYQFSIAHGWMFWIPAVAWAGAFATAYVLFSKLGHPGAHRWLVYVGLGCGLMAGITGTVLILTS